MAESQGACGTSWWGGWIQTVKDKSVAAYDLVSKDLSEFSQTMQTETKKAVKYSSDTIKDKLGEETTSAATSKVKSGISTLLTGISKALVVEPDDKDEQAYVYHDKGDATPIFDRAKARLHSIQVDPETYCQEPHGPPESFEEWLKDFNLDDKKGIISELLVSKVEVRTLYTQMVPSVTSHAVFWQRYFYRIYQLEQDEARRDDLKKRANDIAGSIHEDVDWGNDSEEEGDGVSKSSKHQGQSHIPHTHTDYSLPVSKTNINDLTNISTTDPIQKSNITHDTTIVEAAEQPESIDFKTDSKFAQEENILDQSVSVENVPKSDSLRETSDPDTLNKDNTDVQNDLEHPHLQQSSNAELSINQHNEPQQCENEKESGQPKEETPSAQPASLQTPVTHPADQAEEASDVRTKEKGDLVVVGMGAVTPTISSSEASSNGKDSLEDDWERDFDLELTEDDIRMAQEVAKNVAVSELTGNMDDDDWENWE